MRPAFLLCVAGILVLCGCATYTTSVDHPEKLGPGGSAQALYEQGERFYKAGELDKAIEAYQEAIRLRPNHAGTHNSLGYTYIRTGRLKEAEASFKEAVRLNPGFGCPHYGLAITYFALGNKEAFVREFQEGQRLHPRGAEIAKNWIDGLVKIGQELQKEKAAQGQK